MKDGTTNIPFTKQQQSEFLKKAQKEIDNRLLEIELEMPLETFFKTHNCFGVKIDPRLVGPISS